ncbi:hypothetical protein [Marinoscillum sp.]|uniref:hypothetical protein n=1 Tax=Marinoscillum sp. TaxID=2024838 RepID=UPI003BAD3876
MNDSKPTTAQEEAIALKIAMHLERNIMKNHHDTLLVKRLSDMSNHIQTNYLNTIDSL